MLASNESVAVVFAALGNPCRVAIVRLLAAKAVASACSNRQELSPQCCDVAELSENLNAAASTVSYHLKELRSAGVVTMQKSAQRRLYAVDEAVLREAFSYAGCGLTSAQGSLTQAGTDTGDAAGRQRLSGEVGG